MAALAEQNVCDCPLGKCTCNIITPDEELDHAGRPKDANRVQLLRIPYWILEALLSDAHNRKLHMEGKLVKREGWPQDARILEILPALSPSGYPIHNMLVLKVWSKEFPYTMDGTAMSQFELMFREDKLVCRNCGCDPIKGMSESKTLDIKDDKYFGALGYPGKTLVEEFPTGGIVEEVETKSKGLCHNCNKEYVNNFCYRCNSFKPVEFDAKELVLGVKDVCDMMQTIQTQDEEWTARIPFKGTPQKWEDGADVPPGCNYLESESDSSCNRGTKGCVILHTDSVKLEEPKQPRGGWF